LIQPISRRAMESIGLFEAKTHLSELIARAERG
jgi:antitoxin (DNA-binding transcriptional repressor) of toxin-antitoxin stability system